MRGGMRWPSLLLAVLLLIVHGVIPQPSFAQKAAKPARKVVTRVTPMYPALLKSRHIEGQVHLTAVVLPNGDVAAVQVHGGNPILVDNAITAVKEWKYAPAPSQTEEDVILDFGK
jgi:TonB family protein